MKIIYAASIRLPSEKAHGIQIMNTCSALAKAGADVELVVPKRKAIFSDPFDFYKLPRNFSVQRVFSIDLFDTFLPKSFAFFVQSVCFSLSLIVKYTGQDVIMYGREEAVLGFLSFFFKTVFWETHMGSNNTFSRRLMRKSKGIVCITRGLADFYVSHGVSEDKICVAPDAVDIEKFKNITESKENLRAKFFLPKGRVATYSGSVGLYSWKGVDTFLDALAHVSESDTHFMIVGGKDKDIQKLKETYTDPRIIYAGHVPTEKVGEYLKASDVLVIPNKPGDIISEKYTSPMKLFEYMAAERPIIASRLPSITEILTDRNAYFFTPGDARDLARALTTVSIDTKAKDKAQAAYATVMKYSWTNRGKNIFDFIQNHA